MDIVNVNVTVAPETANSLWNDARHGVAESDFRQQLQRLVDAAFEAGRKAERMERELNRG